MPYKEDLQHYLQARDSFDARFGEVLLDVVPLQPLRMIIVAGLEIELFDLKLMVLIRFRQQARKALKVNSLEETRARSYLEIFKSINEETPLANIYSIVDNLGRQVFSPTIMTRLLKIFDPDAIVAFYQDNQEKIERSKKQLFSYGQYKSAMDRLTFIMGPANRANLIFVLSNARVNVQRIQALGWTVPFAGEIEEIIKAMKQAEQLRTTFSTEQCHTLDILHAKLSKYLSQIHPRKALFLSLQANLVDMEKFVKAMLLSRKLRLVQDLSVLATADNLEGSSDESRVAIASESPSVQSVHHAFQYGNEGDENIASFFVSLGRKEPCSPVKKPVAEQSAKEVPMEMQDLSSDSGDSAFVLSRAGSSDSNSVDSALASPSFVVK